MIFIDGGSIFCNRNNSMIAMIQQKGKKKMALFKAEQRSKACTILSCKGWDATKCNVDEIRIVVSFLKLPEDYKLPYNSCNLIDR